MTAIGTVGNMPIPVIANGSGTAQAGAPDSLTLNTLASEIADAYKYMQAHILSGTGAGQERNVVTSRKNLHPYSQSLDNAAWNNAAGNVTVSPNVIAAPDGTMTADQLIETTNNNFHCVYNLASASAGMLCGSVYLKQGTRRYGVAQIYADGATLRYAVLIDLQTGLFVASNSLGSPAGTGYVITDCGNGWYRVALTILSVLGGTAGTIAANSNSATPSAWGSSLPLYAGDGVSGIYAWGIQLETGAAATAYIHTEAAAAVGVAVATPFNPLPDATSVYEIYIAGKTPLGVLLPPAFITGTVG